MFVYTCFYYYCLLNCLLDRLDSDGQFGGPTTPPPGAPKPNQAPNICVANESPICLRIDFYQFSQRRLGNEIGNPIGNRQ